MDYQVVSNYLNGFQLFFCSLNAIFLLILIRPLYIFSKERTALFILLSKSCSNIIYQFQQIYNSLSYYFPFLQFSYFLIMPSTFLLLNAAYFHIIMLAINRFHAVFFPFNYQIWWKKKNIKYFILIIWLITFVWSILQYIEATSVPNENNKILFFIFFRGIFIGSDIQLLISIFISTPLYTAVLFKFIYDYKNKKMAGLDKNVLKDRVIVLTVCLASLIPLPSLIGLSKLSQFIDNSVQQNIIILTVFDILHNFTYTIIQFIEEVCLLYCSKDFRKLVKKQFIKENNDINTAQSNYSDARKNIKINNFIK